MNSRMMPALILLMIIPILLHTEADQKLIDTTCKRTPDYNLCTSIIRSNPGGGGADVAGLGLILVDTVKHKSNEALSVVSKLSKGAQPKVQAALRRCTEVYKAVVVGDVPVATQTIRGNPKFAETAMADAAAEARVCDVALGGAGAKFPELSNVNSYVARSGEVARAVIRNLL